MNLCSHSISSSLKFSATLDSQDQHHSHWAWLFWVGILWSLFIPRRSSLNWSFGFWHVLAYWWISHAIWSVPNPFVNVYCTQSYIRLGELSCIYWLSRELYIFVLRILADASVIALANNCLHLRSLGLYYCQNITDTAMYALAHSRVKNKHDVWESVRNRYEEEGLRNLNISQCTALTPPAVQALCDSFPALHTCPGRHSLIISGCLNLTSVHCACAVQAHRTTNALSHPAH